MPTQMPHRLVADVIDSAAHEYREAWRDSTLGHQEALEELWDVYQECHRADWDGFGALPVEQSSYAAAYSLIESLPIGFPRPSLGAEPDGQVTLEWRKSPRRVLSVSIDPDGYLHYAGLNGMRKQYGTLPFYFTAPPELQQLVREL